MYVCAYICMYVCMHVHMYACMHVHMYVCLCVYVCMYMFMHYTNLLVYITIQSTNDPLMKVPRIPNLDGSRPRLLQQRNRKYIRILSPFSHNLISFDESSENSNHIRSFVVFSLQFLIFVILTLVTTVIERPVVDDYLHK